MGSGAWRERERGKINGLQILLVLVLDAWVGGKQRDHFLYKIIPQQGTYFSQKIINNESTLSKCSPKLY